MLKVTQLKLLHTTVTFSFSDETPARCFPKNTLLYLVGRIPFLKNKSFMSAPEIASLDLQYRLAKNWVIKIYFHAGFIDFFARPVTVLYFARLNINFPS